MSRKTLKLRGGSAKERINSLKSQIDISQVVHCLSQLKRFAPCIHINTIRSAQFFYNLGRLQELLKETKHPEVWWKPIEEIIGDGNFKSLPAHIDTLKNLIGIEYDSEIIKKGC